MRSEDPRKQPKNMLKSRIGEAIIENLLIEAGNKVRRFGQEWRTTSSQELTPHLFKWVKLPEKTRMKPDLAICNKKGQIEGVEIKFMLKEDYRSFLDEKDYFNKLESHWPGSRVVIVTLEKPTTSHLDGCHIQVLHPGVIDADLYFLRCPIYELEEWGVTRDLCETYERLIAGLPADELINNGGP